MLKIEGSDPGVIAGAEKGLDSRVPNSKGKIAHQVIRAFLLPLFVGGEDQLTIGNSFATDLGFQAQQVDQLAAVVQPNIRHKYTTRRSDRQLRFKEGVRRDVQMQIAERNLILEMVMNTIGSAMLDSPGHLPD